MLRHRFIFPIDNLKKEVEKRTSKLGQMRGTDEQPHLLDRLSLTDGESFMTDEFLQDAAAETYDWIKAFGKRVRNAYRYVPKMEMKEVKENEGAKVSRNMSPVISYHVEQKPVYQMYSDGAGSYFDLERYSDIDEEGTKWGWKAGTMVVYSTIYPVVEGTPLYLNSENPQEVGSVHLSYEPVDGKKTYEIEGYYPNIEVYIGIAKSVDVNLSIFWRKGVEDAPFEKLTSYVIPVHCVYDDTLNAFSFEVELTRSALSSWETIAGVDRVEVEITHVEPVQQIDIHKGDYVKYTNLEGIVRYGISAKEGKEPLCVEEWLDEDFNNSIVFEVELPHWVDRNMIPSAERHLKEALVNYVIWKWMEYVLPKEAEVYEEKFNDKGHQAQLALNTENHTLQLGTDWLTGGKSFNA